MRRLIASMVLLASATASAAPWEISGSFAELSLDTASVAPSLRYPGTTAIWITYAPSMSVDCSPPRGCYARTQRIQYVFQCAPRLAMPVERLSMDMNGSVINHELRSATDAYSANIDVGAALILNTYCPAMYMPDRRDRN